MVVKIVNITRRKVDYKICIIRVKIISYNIYILLRIIYNLAFNTLNDIILVFKTKFLYFYNI